VGEAELLVGIAPVRVINGEAPAWVREMVLRWVQEHQTELLDNWFRCGNAIRPSLSPPRRSTRAVGRDFRQASKGGRASVPA